MSDTPNVAAQIPAPSELSPNTSNNRKKSIAIFLVVVVLIAVIAMLWVWLSSATVKTDNAYVGANTAQVTSMLNAQVAQVLVNDTVQVHKGDILVRLNDSDAKIAVAQATAQLSKVQRQFKQSVANSSALDSQIYVSRDAIQSAAARLHKAQADYTKAIDDLNRRQKLVAIGGVSQEELSSAKNLVNSSRAALEVAQADLSQAQSSRKAAQSNLAANDALIQGVNENDTPDVLIAKANLAQAQLDLQRTVIRAPIDGVITNRTVQTGQRIAAGAAVMKIVPIEQLYVDANFKESQLSQVKIGQKAELVSDFYGKKVIYHGTVVGFSGGTGAAFAMIPAQNATGNWIKVVQRLPVRISLNSDELKAHPLRVGLSMEAKVFLQ